MKNTIKIITLFILLTNSSFAQSFGDSYQSVLKKVNGIIEQSDNEYIKCDFNVSGIEGIKIYGFNSKGKLASLITQHFLKKDDGKALYKAYCDEYKRKFGNPQLDDQIEKCYEGTDCWKNKSKWQKNNESLIVSFYTLSGESLVQTHYLTKAY